MHDQDFDKRESDEQLLNSPFFASLAGATLQPALGSLLIFDAPPSTLRRVADHWRQLLERTSRLPVEQATLSAFEQDDDLWGSLSLPTRNEHGLTLTQHPLLFSPERNRGHIQLITIPDLGRLSLAAARACIMLIGSSVAHLERNEQSAVWQPRQVWLASCHSAGVGAISPHLLDRFALRLTWSDPTQQASRSHEERVIDLLSKNWQALDTLTPPPDPREFQLLEQAVQQEVELTTEALERVLDVLDGMTSEYYYPRRELALARYALALCQLAGETRLTTSHVEKAAALLGLQQESQERTEPLQESDESSPTEPAEAGSDTGEGTVKPPISLPALSVEIVQSVAAQAQGVTLVEPDNVLVPDRPYPEDTEPPAREAASLRVPFHRFTTGRSDRGPVFGVEPSETLEDLSITSTLLTALRFQKLRQKRYEQSRSRGEQGIVGEASLSSPDSPIQAAANADRLMIELNDLRRYRREHAPEEMLLLLLDYTSMRNCAWEDALLPFLSEAYIHRACISIIKVGAQDATSPLQAGLVEARSILVPRIGQALETPAGKASPLAHGLDLAQQILHRTLQHGRSAVQRVTLVVLSDGRGNVPLEASRKNSLTEIVAREGVDDSLKVAHILRGINRVEKILLNPQPRYYADLPYRLAEALGATVIDIPREALEAEATR